MKESKDSEKRWIKKVIKKIVNFGSKYPLDSFIIYFYAIFFLLLFFIYYTLLFLLVMFPKLNEISINYSFTLIILLSILILYSFELTILFEKSLARQIHGIVANLLDKWIRSLPVWIYRTCIFILILFLIYLINCSIEYSFNQFYNVVIKNKIKTLARWSSGVVAVFSLFFQFCIINTPDLKIGMLIKNAEGKEKLVTDSYLGGYLKDNILLKVIATNKGKAKATYRIWGICAQDENFDLYNKELNSRLIQPKIYYKNRSKKQPINEKGELLGENESSNIYYLKFSKVPKENFQIVFLEYPNKLVFLPIYIKRKKRNYNFLKSKLFYFPFLLITLLIAETPYAKSANNILSKREERIVIINNHKYKLLEVKKYNKENLYTIVGENLRLINLSFFRDKNNSNVECLVTLRASKKATIYFKSCQISTKNKRKYNADIESIYQLRKKDEIQYKILVNVGYIEHVNNIEEISINCLNPDNNMEDNLDLVFE